MPVMKATFLVCVTLFVGCMSSPEHPTRVASRYSNIPFSGYTFSANQEVVIQPWYSYSSDGIVSGDGAWLPTDPLYGIAVRGTTGNTSSINWFGSDLYHWSVSDGFSPALWEPGVMGHQIHVRGSAGSYSLMTFDAHTPAIDCITGTTDWTDFSNRCSSDSDGVVRVETVDYVPYFTSKTDCVYGDAGCNRCVPDVLAELTSTLSVPSGGANQLMSINVTTVASTANHLQGMVRLSDVDVGEGQLSGRIMVSRDGTRNIGANVPGHMFFFEQLNFVTGSTPFLDGSNGFLIQDIEIDSDSTHPGGLGSVGDIVAVPMEREVGEVIFYGPNDGDPFSYAEVSRLNLGAQGEPEQPMSGGEWAVASVSLVQLVSGRYLMYLAGPVNGQVLGWFYLSDQDVIDEQTDWRFIDTWYPDCVADPANGHPGNCWVGAGNSVMFSQCDGQVFLVGMLATDGNVPSYASVRRLTQTTGSHEIEAVHVATLVGDGPPAIGSGDATFAWGATMSVGPGGSVAVEMTERDIDGTGSNTSISIAKFRPL